MAQKNAQGPKGQTPPQNAPKEPKEAREGQVQRFVHYVEDSRAELRKVTWPSVKETRQATLAVLGFVAAMAIILGLVDLGLSNIIKSFLS